MPNPGGTLRPGLYAYATIIVEEHQDVLTVPTTAVVQDKDKAFCVVVADGKAVRRPVEIGTRATARGPRSSPASRGAKRVVKANAASLSDGQAVKVQRRGREGRQGL